MKGISMLMILTLTLVVLSQAKLVYLTSLYRHGARYPVGNVYDGNETKPYHGLLTSIGLRQHYNLGNYIKEDYIDKFQLTSATLNPKDIDIVTTGSLRCVESAYAQAAGLFPLENGQKIPDNIKPEFLEPPFAAQSKPSLNIEVDTTSEWALDRGYQPVPIITSNELFPHCKNEVKLIEKRVIDIAPIIAETQVLYTEFILRITEIFKLPITLANIAGMIELYDVVICDLNLGRPMPKSFTEHDLRHLEFIQNYYFALLNQKEYDRVFATPILKQMMINMENVISGKLHKKMTLLSAHDTNVAPMLTFLNLTTPNCLKKKFHNQTVTENCAKPVPFASSLLLELHQKEATLEGSSDPADYYVKVRYNGDYYKLCESANTECGFSEFARRVRQHLVDYDKQCGNK